MFNLRDFTVYIFYDFAVKSSTSGFDILTYSYIRYLMFGGYEKTFYIQPETLSMYMFGDTKHADRITKSLNNLPIGSFQNKVFRVEPDECKITGGYVAFPFYAIQQIASEGGRSWDKLLKFAILIQANMRRDLKLPDGKLYVSDYPQAAYASKLGIKNIISIQQLITKLESMDILYVRRSRVPHTNNLMGFKWNEGAINKYANGIPAYRAQRDQASNTKRSLMQKYNQICKGREYDRQTIAEVRDYILQYNAEQRQLQEQFPDDDYLTNIKPTEPLDKLLV